MNKINVFWIRNDLRLNDNIGLINAIENTYKNKDKLLLFFNINSEQIRINEISNDYFFSALNIFNKTLNSQNIKIFFAYGTPEEAFKHLLNNFNISKLFFNASERGYGLKRDLQIQNFLKDENIEIYRYLDHHLIGAHQILNQNNCYYKVFTAYYNKWKKIPKKAVKKVNIEKLQTIIFNDFQNSQDNILKLILQKRTNIFDNECGYKNAMHSLEYFAKYNLDNYFEFRDFPYINKTSKLAQYLTTGEISVREIFNIINMQKNSLSKETFIKELCWRDFYNMIYAINPNQKYEENNVIFRNIKYPNNIEWLKKWQNGETGFPIIDSAIIQLKTTGFMHNRLRMIVSSFLVKDLLIDWKYGEEFFKKYLKDYDSASNIGGWQWSASVGTDAVPYFRIFNPILQSKKFDPQGKFIQKYLPQLKNVPLEYIHEPYKMNEELKNKIGFIDNQTYPKQIVDHDIQRKKCLDLYNIKK
ncbi:cryptochrome/photolyase family protein [Mycoplasmopsis lipofaciens]|uniref:cryptochrome/photolyase family protein n=1 Tax=Mycoplasmopsis lipofaciens TaxID=114884 RepID=UPI000481EA89|nr:deoxyribodipyrimidine photo-lyase [Mycoplasmopsis lipofaciens]